MPIVTDLKVAWCKPGDYVVYGKYQGDKFFQNKNVLLFDDQILMVVPNGDLILLFGCKVILYIT